MTQMKRRTLDSVQAEIEELLQARGRRNFDPEQQAQYDRLVDIEHDLIVGGGSSAAKSGMSRP
jgi:hypothetical protein